MADTTSVQLIMIEMLKNILEDSSKDPNILGEMVKSMAKMINGRPNHALDMSLMPPEVALICSVCQKPALKCCRRCAMMYCSSKCQEDDWRGIHRFICLSPDESFNTFSALSVAQKKFVSQVLNDNKLFAVDPIGISKNDSNVISRVQKGVQKSSNYESFNDELMQKGSLQNEHSNCTENSISYSNHVGNNTQGVQKYKHSSEDGNNIQGNQKYNRSSEDGNNTQADRKYKHSSEEKFNGVDRQSKMTNEIDDNDSSSKSVSSNGEKKHTHVNPKNFRIRNTTKKPLLGDYVQPSNDHQFGEEMPVDPGFAAQHSKVGNTIELTLKFRQEVASFVCIGVPKSMENDYTRFKKELAAAAKSAKHHKSRKRDHIASLAVIREFEDNTWSRALYSTSGAWQFVDRGEVTKKKEEHHWKSCPASCASMPHRTCLLTVNNPKNSLEVGQTYTCTVTSMDEPSEVLVQIKTGYTTLYGKLTQWVKLAPQSAVFSPNDSFSASSPSSKEVSVDDFTKKKLFAKTSALIEMGCDITGRQDIENAKKSSFVKFQSLLRPEIKDGDVVSMIQCVTPSKPIFRVMTKEKIFEYENVVDSIAQYGVDAEPLDVLPSMHDVVIVRHKDGIFYRGTVKALRDTSSENHCTVRLIDTGEVISAQLSDMRSSPAEIVSAPMSINFLKLQGLETLETQLVKPCVLDYVNNLIRTKERLVCKRTGNSYVLTVESTKESVNRRIMEMSAAEWRQIIDKGDDIVTSTPVYTLDMIEYQTLKSNDLLLITDNSELKSGILSCILADPQSYKKLVALNEQMEIYCKSVKDPYMPRISELCIAKFGEDEQWYRAFVLGPSGGDSVLIMFMDYGNTASCNFTDIRKMMPEFVEALPAQASCCHIKDFANNAKKYLDQADGVLSTGSSLTPKALELVESGNYSITLSL